MITSTYLVEYALTLMQPWASIVAGLPGLDRPKLVENREWCPPPRLKGRWLAIHAGKGWDRSGQLALAQLGVPIHAGKGWDRSGQLALAQLGVPVSDYPRSAVVACCRVTGYVDARVDPPLLMGDLPPAFRSVMAVEEHTWWCGPVGWLLDDVVPIEPVTGVRGMLGVWDLGTHREAVSEALKAALAARRAA